MTEMRQNYNEESEAGINKTININLKASYAFSSMAFYFDRDDVALDGFHTFFTEISAKKRKFANKLMSFQNTRGGRIVLQDIQKPDKDEYGTGLEAMQAAMAMVKTVNQSFLDLIKFAHKHSDPEMEDFVEDEFLKEVVELLKTLSDHVTNLQRAGPGLGEYLFNKETLCS